MTLPNLILSDDPALNNECSLLGNRSSNWDSNLHFQSLMPHEHTLRSIGRDSQRPRLVPRLLADWLLLAYKQLAHDIAFFLHGDPLTHAHLGGRLSHASTTTSYDQVAWTVRAVRC